MPRWNIALLAILVNIIVITVGVFASSYKPPRASDAIESGRPQSAIRGSSRDSEASGIGITDKIKPQFVDRDNSEFPDQVREAIIEAARKLLISENPGDEELYGDNLTLKAVGKQYILVTELGVHGADDIIIDLKSSTSTDDLWYQYSFETRKGTVVYILGDNILTYSIDQPLFAGLSGACQWRRQIVPNGGKKVYQPG
jgi:hypothetical protein